MKKRHFVFGLLFLFSTSLESFGAAAVDQRSPKSLEEQVSQIKISESYGRAMETRKNLLKIPEKKKTIRDALKHSSSQEFTGALEWAHGKGIFGNGTNVLIGEPLFSKEHAGDVMDVVKMIAPQTKISLKLIGNTSPAPVNNTIINASFGAKESQLDKENYLQAGQVFFKLLHPTGMRSANNLLVVAAGNSGLRLDISMAGKAIEGSIFFALPPKGSLSVGKFPTIIVGSLKSRSDKSRFSNRPGFSPEIQKRFLYTLGEEVYVLDKSSKGLRTINGTSFAAPAVSGAAALILSAHPDFSMEEVANTLLESAEKNFIEDEIKTLVYDSTDTSTKKILESRYTKSQTPMFDDRRRILSRRMFNPEVDGRGVLSLRRAFIYADIYERVKNEMPQASIEEWLAETTDRFKKEIQRLDHVHATSIQKHFRGWKARKEAQKMKRIPPASAAMADQPQEAPRPLQFESIDDLLGDDLFEVE